MTGTFPIPDTPVLYAISVCNDLDRLIANSELVLAYLEIGKQQALELINNFRHVEESSNDILRILKTSALNNYLEILLAYENISELLETIKREKFLREQKENDEKQ